VPRPGGLGAEGIAPGLVPGEPPADGLGGPLDGRIGQVQPGHLGEDLLDGHSEAVEGPGRGDEFFGGLREPGVLEVQGPIPRE
jgi:hypothetical protein